MNCCGLFTSKEPPTSDPPPASKAETSTPTMATSSKVVLLTGASGNVGKATIQALAEYSSTLQVKAGVRNPEKSKDLASLAPNASVVAADPLNASQIAEALKGVDSLFIITPGSAERTQVAVAALEAAKEAGTKFVLILSVLTAELTDTIFGKQFEPIEAKAKAVGVPYTIIRLPLFLDNQYGNIGSIKGQGTWYDAIDPEQPYTPVAVQDVAAVAAKILSDPTAHIGKTYKLASPSDTNTNLGKYYSEAIGKPVVQTKVPYEGVKTALLGFGMEEWQVDGVLELEKLINEGSPVTNDPEGAKHVEAILGRPATTFQAWVQGAAPAFK